MAEAYGEEVREAAKTLHIEGLSSREIRDRLRDGNAGLAYRVEPSERTIDGWRRKWRKEGIRAALTVRAGDEDSTENAIYRRILGVCRQAVAKLEEQELNDKVDTALVNRIARYQGIIDAARVKRSIVTKRERGEKLTAKEGAALGHGAAEATEPSMLDVLAAAEQDRETGQTDQSNTGDIGNNEPEGQATVPTTDLTEDKQNEGGIITGAGMRDAGRPGG